MKKLGCLFVLLVLGGILMATNPSHQAHVDAVRTALKERRLADLGIDADYLSIGQGLLGAERMDALLGKFVVRNNYWVFSLTQIDLGAERKTVGIGIAGHVWLIDKLLTEQSDGQ